MGSGCGACGYSPRPDSTPNFSLTRASLKKAFGFTQDIFGFTNLNNRSVSKVSYEASYQLDKSNLDFQINQSALPSMSSHKNMDKSSYRSAASFIN